MRLNSSILLSKVPCAICSHRRVHSPSYGRFWPKETIIVIVIVIVIVMNMFIVIVVRSYFHLVFGCLAEP